MRQRLKQKIFNKVVRHLLKQNKKSLKYDNITCAYRGKDGVQCAIGCLIPDEDYTKAMDIHPDIILNYPNKISSFLKEKGYMKSFEDQEFLIGLQGIHDSYDIYYWRTQLVSFGKEHNLDLSIFDKI